MNKKLFKMVLIIGIIAVITAGLFRVALLNSSRNVNIITSSTLTEAINISDLSTAEFKYRGIADVYTDDNRTNVRCRICYSAVVKAGISMKEVKFDVDTKNKVVTATLPDIGIKVNIIDEQSMSVLPSDADVGIADMLKYSKEDAEKEAMESGELIAVARENLEATIKGLLLPILEPQGYTLEVN